MIKLQSFKIISIKKSALGEFCHFLFWNVLTFYLIDFGVPKMGFLVFFSGEYLGRGEGQYGNFSHEPEKWMSDRAKQQMKE